MARIENLALRTIRIPSWVRDSATVREVFVANWTGHVSDGRQTVQRWRYPESWQWSEDSQTPPWEFTGTDLMSTADLFELDRAGPHQVPGLAVALGRTIPGDWVLL